MGEAESFTTSVTVSKGKTTTQQAHKMIQDSMQKLGWSIKATEKQSEAHLYICYSDL